METDQPGVWAGPGLSFALESLNFTLCIQSTYYLTKHEGSMEELTSPFPRKSKPIVVLKAQCKENKATVSK